MDARRIPARHGMLWLAAGFALFRRNPPLMTAITFSYLLMVILVNLVPGIGPFLLPLLLPTLTAMLGNGCRAVESGRPFASEVLLTGIQTQPQAMARLGGLHLLGSILLVLVSMVLGDPINIKDGLDADEMQAMVMDMALMLVLASPLLMAFWFAPLLTAWDGVPAGKSLFFSFVASWRNWRAFAAYGLTLGAVGILLPGLVLVIAGMISPALAGTLSVFLRMMLIFILAPTLVASVYLSYQDVFHPRPRSEPEPELLTEERNDD